jgi:hypothetical protein
MGMNNPIRFRVFFKWFWSFCLGIWTTWWPPLGILRCGENGAPNNPSVGYNTITHCGQIFKPTLDGGSKVQICMIQFGLIWSKLNPWVQNLSLHLDSSNHELFLCGYLFIYLFIYLFPNQLIFPKMVPCRLSFDLPPFGLGPSSKGHGSYLWALIQ